MTIFTIPAALRFYGHQLLCMGVLKTLSWQKLSATSLLVTLSPLKSSQPIPTGDPSIYGKGHFRARVEKQRLKSTERKAGSASKGGSWKLSLPKDQIFQISNRLFVFSVTTDVTLIYHYQTCRDQFMPTSNICCTRCLISSVYQNKEYKFQAHNHGQALQSSIG